MPHRGAQRAGKVGIPVAHLLKSPDGVKEPFVNTATQFVLGAAGALLACSASASDQHPIEAIQEHARIPEHPSAQYRVQLGLYADRETAQKALARIEARVGGQLQGFGVIQPSDSESSYGVASGPMSATDAEVACGKLIAEHCSCAVVKR